MGGSWAKRPVLKKTSCNRSTTSVFDFQQTGQLATGLITIDRNWQLQSSCDQLQSSPVASLCTSCQLDFETLKPSPLSLYTSTIAPSPHPRSPSLSNSRRRLGSTSRSRISASYIGC